MPDIAAAPHAAKFTIITVVRNGARTLESTIRSVLEQKAGSIEYVIVDGASTDGTLDIIRKYDERIDLWISEPDSGIYDAMNKGIALSSGKLIGILNADDVYESGALAAIATAWEGQNEPRNTLVYGDYAIIDEELGISTYFPAHERYWQGMTICHQAMFISRDVYERHGLYDTGLRYAADYDFLVRSKLAGVRFVHVPRQIVSFSNAGATYQNVSRSNREALRLHRRYFGLLSRNFMYYFLFGFLRSYLVTGMRRGLGMVLSKRGLSRAKVFYNRLARRESRDL